MPTPTNPYDDLESAIDGGEVDAPAQPEANPYESLEQGLDDERSGKVARLKKLMEIGGAAAPDRTAGILALARETGLKHELVAGQYDLLQQRFEAAKYDAGKYLDENPDQAHLLLDAAPAAAGVVMKDEQVSGFTRAVRETARLRDTETGNGVLDTVISGFTKNPIMGPVIESNVAAFRKVKETVTGTGPVETPKQVPTIEAPGAHLTGLDRLTIFADRWGQSRLQSELSSLGAQLLLADAQGRDGYELEKKILDLQQRTGIQRDYHQGPVEQVLLDGLDAVSSQLDVFAGAGKGAAVGAALTGGAALLATKSPKEAISAGRVGLSIGAKVGGFAQSAWAEAGGMYPEVRQMRTDDGQLVDRDLAMGLTAAYGLVAGGVEMASMDVLLGSVGPLKGFIAEGNKKAFVAALLGDRTKRGILREVGKAWAKGAAAEGAEGAVQQASQSLATWGISSGTAGKAQKFDWDKFRDDVATSFYKEGLGGALLGVGGSAVNLTSRLAAFESSTKGGAQVAAIAKLPASPAARGAPALLARIVEAETAKSGQKVENLYVDAPAIVRLFQSQGIDPDEAAREIMGEEGPARLQAALAGANPGPNGEGRLEVGLEEYLSKWGNKGIAEALVEDTAARPGAMTTRELVKAQQEDTAAMQKRADALVAEWEQAEKDGTPATQESAAAERMTAAIRRQLIATGRSDPASARTEVAATQAFIETQAARIGVPADILFDHYSTEVERAADSAEAAATAQQQADLPPGDAARYEARLKMVQRLEAIPQEIEDLYEERLAFHQAEAEKTPDAYRDVSPQDRADAEIHGKVGDPNVLASLKAEALRQEQRRLERDGPSPASLEEEKARVRVRAGDVAGDVQAATQEALDAGARVDPADLVYIDVGEGSGLTPSEVADQALSPEAQELADRIAAALDDALGPQPDAEVVAPPNGRLFQVQNLPEWELKVRAWMENQGHAKPRIDAHIAAMRGQMKIFSALGPVQLKKLPRGRGLNKGPAFTEKTENAGKRSTPYPGGPLRDNEDDIYVLSFDLSAMCVKRLEIGATIAWVQDKLNERAAKAGKKARALTNEERMALLALFREAGKTAPCLYCYVEAPRGKSGELVDKALSIAFGEQPINPKWADSTKASAQAAIEEVKRLGLTAADADPNYFTDPAVADSAEAKAKAAKAKALYAFMGRMAASVTVNKPKLYEEYTGQILDVPDEMIEELNGYAGFRFFSSSDFQFEHVADLMQAIFDLNARGAKSHAYTKVVEYVEIFGGTGQKIQTSIFAKRNEKGEIVEDDEEGMGWADAKRLRKKFKNVGSVFVATDDDMIRWALDQPWIDYIIPFHHSGMEGRFFKEMGWKSYQSVQSEKWADPEKKGKPPKIRMWELGAEKGIPNEKLTKNYLKKCKERGIQPVFPQFADHPQYAKLKKDYSRTDTPFDVVQPKFNLKAAKGVLDAYFAGEAPKAAVDKGLAKKLLQVIENLPEGADIGVEALRALNQGRDIVKTLRRMNQAAYHGTPHRGIDRFSLSAMGTGQGAQSYGWGLYFAQNKKVAEEYRKQLARPELVIDGKRHDPKAADAVKGGQWTPAALIHQALRQLNAVMTNDPSKLQADLLYQANIFDRESGRVNRSDEIRANMKAAAALARELAADTSRVTIEAGQVYKVDVPEDAEMLDYDKKLVDQPAMLEKLKAAGIIGETIGKERKLVIHLPDNANDFAFADQMTGQKVYEWLEEAAKRYIDSIPEMDEDTDAAKMVSLMLGEAGIPGLMYFDELSRPGVNSRNPWVLEWKGADGRVISTFRFPEESEAKSAIPKIKKHLAARGLKGLTFEITKEKDTAKRTRNYVVWNEESIAILDRLYQADPWTSQVDLRSNDMEITHPEAPLRLKASFFEQGPGGEPIVTVNLLDLGVPETPENIDKWKGQGYSTALYIRALQQAKEMGLGLQSDISRTDPTEKMYARLRDVLGIPIVKAKSSTGFDVYTISAEELAKVDLDAAWRTLLAETEIKRLEAGLRLFQVPKGQKGKKSASTGPRAWVDIVQQGLAKVFKIALTERSDRSSFLHESSHTFLEMLLDLSERPDAPQRLKDDAAGALQWLGHATREEMRAKVEEIGGVLARAKREGRALTAEEQKLVDSHPEEKWARAFEAYLMEGKAPSPKLVRAFTQFRLWLLEVYKSVTGLGVELDPEIRGIFDRMLATDAEIESMKRAMGVAEPLFKGPEEAGMTPEQYQAYLDDRAKSFAEATLRTQRKVMKDRLQATEAWWKEQLEATEEQVAEEFDARDDVRAFAYLKRGELVMPDGRKISEPGMGKLDLASVKRIYGPNGIPSSLTDLLHNRIAKEDGETADDVAQRYGFANGRALLDAIQAIPEKKAWVAEEAARRMEEEHPDILNEKTRIGEEAAASLHNEGTSDWLLKEYAALRSKGGANVINPETGKRQHVPSSLTGGPTAPLEAIRLAAKQIVDRMVVKGMSAARAMQAEQRAAEQAAIAAAKGDFKLAAVHKQQQLLQHYVYRELAAAREDRDSFEKLAERMVNPTRRGTMGKAGGVFLDAADSILEALGFRAPDPVAGERPTMPEIMSDLEKAGIIPAFMGDRLSALVSRPPSEGWKGLTVDDMRTVGAALAQLYVAARDANTVLMEGKRKEVQAVADGIASETKKRKPQRAGSDTAAPKGYWATQRVEGFNAALTDPEVILQELGPTAYKFFWNGYLAARDREYDLSGKILKFFSEKWDSLPEEMQASRYDLIDASALPFPPDLNRDGSLRDRQWMWMVALNMGNRGNVDRLVGGYGWNEKQVRAFLQANMTPAEWDFVEGVWTLMDKELWPDIAATYEAVNGIKPEKVEALPFVLESGRVIRGGYFPARYDPVASRLGQNQDVEAAERMYSQRSGAMSVAKSFTKGRVKKYEDVINLQWSYVPSHVANVIHYVAFDHFVRDGARVLTNGTTRTAVERHSGVKYYAQLKAWLQVVANAQNDGIPEALEDAAFPFIEAKSRFVISTLGYSMTTALGDFTNPLVAIAAGEKHGGVGSRFMAPVLLQSLRPGVPGTGVASGFRVIREAALSKSRELRARSDNMSMLLRRQLAELGRAGKQGGFSKLLEATRDTAWFFMEMTDALTSTVIWEGAYRQALARGKDEQTAIADADGRVRAMLPGHSAAEMPAFLRDKRGLGGLIAFYGYFNKLHNIRRRVWQDAYSDWADAGAGKQGVAAVAAKAKVLAGREVAAAAGRTLAMFFAANVIGELLSGRGPDEDEEVPEWLLRKMLASPFLTIPLAGQLAEPAANTAVTKLFHGHPRWRSFSMRASPAAAALERFVKAADTVVSSKKDVDQRLWALLEMFGVVFKTPVGSSQVTRTGRYLTGELADDIVSGRWDEVVSGPVYGERNFQPTTPFTILNRK